MRIGIGIPNTPRRSVAPSPGVGPWLADLLPLPSPTPGGLGDFNTGINFTVPSAQTCTGVRADWSSSNGSPISVVLSLWNTSAFALIASETVTVLNGIIQTTGAFGAHGLTPGVLYGVSTYNAAYYNHYVTNPFTLPRNYPKYDVFFSYSYAAGYFANNIANNTVCSYVEPVIL